MTRYDAVIIGAGPNGLAAAITLAQAGCAVLVVEAKATIGGGLRSAELTLPGFTHDICAAIHPLGVASPFFKRLPLQKHGLTWITPPAALAHPLDNHPALLVEQDLTTAAAQLGPDAPAYTRLLAGPVRNYERILAGFLGPLRLPRSPLAMARFALPALLPATALARLIFRQEPARALFAGMAAHAILPLERPPTAAFGLMLTLLAHAVGWPVARGGSQQIAEALARCLRSLGGEIQTGWPVQHINELPPARAYLFDVTPRQLLAIAGERLPRHDQRQMRRYRYGPGVFKIDYALSAPIPWQDTACLRAGTVHVGGTLAEIAAAERSAWRGQHSAKPFVLVAQQSLFDSTRAPKGQHTAWAYCHVPHGSTADMTAALEAQIERFAPGFRDCILARHTFNTHEYEAYNANYIGGDINGGAQGLGQLFTRPTLRLTPYRTGAAGIYLCSSSTPPGGGVHGMSGYHAAQTALRDLRRSYE